MELVERRRKVDSRGIQLVRSINRNETTGREKREREREREREWPSWLSKLGDLSLFVAGADAARDRSFDFWDRWPTIAVRDLRGERETRFPSWSFLFVDTAESASRDLQNRNAAYKSD